MNTPPNVVPNMPASLPQAPDGSPGQAPIDMQSQQAGPIGFGCLGCASKFPLWAKMLVPIGIIGVGVTLAIVLAQRRPHVPLYEE